MKRYSLFIGRWQPWHQGHRWLIDRRLNEGMNVCIAVRDVPTNKKQPWTAEDIKENIEHELSDLINEGRVKIIVIPDIESVNYGRGVGYDIIEHEPPPQIKRISATEIRNQMRDNGEL